LQDDLRFVLITSSAMLKPVATAADEAVIVTASAHAKCERCWHYRDDVGRADVGRDNVGRNDTGREGTGAAAGHPGLCGRCVSNLYGAGEPRAYA
jgi:isoleucyl-tRNA synthetase